VDQPVVVIFRGWILAPLASLLVSTSHAVEIGHPTNQRSFPKRTSSWKAASSHSSYVLAFRRISNHTSTGFLLAHQFPSRCIRSVMPSTFACRVMHTVRQKNSTSISKLHIAANCPAILGIRPVFHERTVAAALNWCVVYPR
jgi:hypothetical protein